MSEVQVTADVRSRRAGYDMLGNIGFILLPREGEFLERKWNEYI